MPSPIRVLALHAHPDDLEFQCAGTLALLREAGCARDDGHDDPRRLRQRRARRRGDRGDPPGRGQGGGRADRGRLPLPGVPRPGDLQRRRVAAEGHRGPAAGPARPRPDRAAGRLPVRPRDDQPAGPRRLLRRAACPTTSPGSGSPPRRSTGSPTSTSSTPSRGSTATAVPSRPVSSSTSRGSSPSSGRCSPVTPASANWLLRQHGMDEYLESQAQWGARRGAEIGVAQAEGFRQYLGHPYPKDNLLLSLIGVRG